MLKKFYPFEYFDSPFLIDYTRLYNKGFRGLIFDIDNTLVGHGKPSTVEVDDFFKKLHAIGFRTLLLSNNSEERVLSFKKNIETLYIAEAEKPKIDGYLEALKMLSLDKKSIIYIGDQISIDILGANKAAVPNILVKYVGYGKEKKIGIRRRLENLILWFYKKSKYQHRILGIPKNTNEA